MTEPKAEEIHAQPSPSCVCGGAGPLLTEMLRRVGPSESVKRHFDQARVEFLKGLRAMIDERIEKLSDHESKGTKLNVE